jgi:hypothetical protein
MKKTHSNENSGSAIGVVAGAKRLRGISMLFIVFFVCCRAMAQSFDYAHICGTAPAGPPDVNDQQLSNLRQGNGGNIISSTCTANSPAYLNKYGQQSYYIPTANDPVLTLKLTYHVINNSAGTDGPWLGVAGDNALHLNAQYMNNFTERYSCARSATYTLPFSCSYPAVGDMRIRYEVTNVYYYYDNAMNVTTNGASIANYINTIDPSRLTEGMPIVFNSGSIPGAAGFMQNYNGITGVQSFVNMNGNDPWWLQEHLRHEIGHCLGLYHTYAGGGDEMAMGFVCTHPDFLCDVFPKNNPNCPTGTLPCNVCYEGGAFTSNNIMGGQGGNCWYSPLQIGRMRRHLYLPFNNSRRFIKEMVSDTVSSWLITSDETWDFDIQMYQDIIVKPGATLTLKCKVGMADLGRIIVERGARLIIDGGEVYAWGKNWKGIQVWGTTTKRQLIAGNGLCVDQGIVSIINQGTLRDAIDGISTGKYYQNGNMIAGYTGGIIRCDGANFINNWRAVQYVSYRNFIPVGSFPTADNLGYFYNCKFETNDLLKNTGQQIPYTFISLWEVQGLKFYGNTYQNTRNPLPLDWDERGDAINSIDASYTVDRYKICGVSGPNGCVSYTTNNPSNFNNLRYGIHVQNSIPATSVKINDNDFYNCNRSVYVGGTYNTGVTNNRIDVGGGTTQMNHLPYGIYMEFSSAYDISNNTIFTTQTTNYNYSLGTGICINGSNGYNNTLYRNNINMMSVGAAVYGDNRGPGTGNGLKLKCNQFGQGVNGKNMYDIYMGEQPGGPTPWYNGKIDSLQGSSTQGANNFFSHTGSVGSNIRSDFYDKGPGPLNSSNPPSSFAYFYNPETSQLTQPWYYNNSLNPIALGAAYNSSMCPQTMGGGSGSIRQLLAMQNERTTTSPSELGYAIDDAIRTLLGESGTGTVNEEEVIALMKMDPRGTTPKRLLATYLSFNRLEEAKALLEEIRSSNGGRLDNFCKLQEALINARSGEGNVFTHASGLKSLLNDLKNGTDDESSVNAAALLSLLYNEPHSEYVHLPNSVSSTDNFLFNVSKEKEEIIPIVRSFNIFPNPATGTVSVAFVTPRPFSNAEVMIYDVMGKLVVSQPLNVADNVHSIDLHTLTPGMYFVNLVLDGQVSEKQKLIKH